MSTISKLHHMPNWMMWILPENVVAITIAPFGIYSKPEGSIVTLFHEEIHWKQQVEMLIIFFYAWYLIEYLIKYIKYGKAAYMKLSFEQKAYKFERDGSYAYKRKHYAWLKYLFV